MTIKELREEKDLSQGKFADSIGIGRTAIVGYEKGKFKPSTEVTAKIKEVYGVNVDEAASAAPAPVEEKKTAKRGKKKDTPAEGEVTPSVEEKTPASKKKGSRKKAAPAAETTPAVEEKKPTPKKGGRKKAAASETAPAVEEKKSAPKKGSRKKAALASETAPATEEKKTTKRGKKATAAATETTPAVEEKKPAPKKRGGRKKAEVAPAPEEAKPAEEKKTVEEKKPAKRGTAKKDGGVVVVIQSPMGGSITPEEIIKKTGSVDAIYIRVDENKAYWVRGDETGSVDLW